MYIYMYIKRAYSKYTCIYRYSTYITALKPKTRLQFRFTSVSLLRFGVAVHQEVQAFDWSCQVVDTNKGELGHLLTNQ